MKSDLYDSIDISWLTPDVPAEYLNNELILSDNLHEEVDFLHQRLYLDRQGQLFRMHTTTALLVCFGGEFTLETNNNRFVLHKGEATFFYSGMMGRGIGISEDCRFLLVAASNSFFLPQLSSEESGFLQMHISTNPVCHLTEQQLRQIEQMYYLIRFTLARKDEYQFPKRTSQGLLQAIYFTLFNAYKIESRAAKVSPNAHLRSVYQRFVELVQEHFRQERNIRFYADKMCVTPRYLSQLIYKSSGQFAGDIIDYYVVTEAKMLIRSRRFTMTQVSIMLNFTCPSYFNRYFKKHVGCTPMEYLEQG